MIAAGSLAQHPALGRPTPLAPGNQSAMWQATFVLTIGQPLEPAFVIVSTSGEVTKLTSREFREINGLNMKAAAAQSSAAEKEAHTEN